MEEGFDLWFCCDGCMDPIPEQMFRFDCTRCENFSFCLKCYMANTTHSHRFKKQKVPAGQGPPQNSNELIAKAFMQCTECHKSLIDLSKRVFTCEKCSESVTLGDAVYWCKKCEENTEHEHKRTKLKPTSAELAMSTGKTNEKGEETTRYLDNLFEDYHNLECEDVIGGGAIKARFGY